MTSSAVRFRGEAIHVEDRALREFLKAVAHHLAEANAAHAPWLVEATACWMNDHENCPPGLRDLDLDEVLTTPGRLTDFADYLRWLERASPPIHVYEAETARRVIHGILTKWALVTSDAVLETRPQSLGSKSDASLTQPAAAMNRPVDDWCYWGRTGGTGTIATVLRLPRALYEGRLEFSHFAFIERLHPDGSWSKEAGASAVAEKDWIHGCFDEADEIDVSTVEAVLLKWNAGNGR